MKRLIWVIVAVAAVVAMLIGWGARKEAVLDRELQALEEVEDSAAAYAGAVQLLRGHPDLQAEQLSRAVGILTNAAYESGDVGGIVTALDSLTESPLSEPVIHRLKAELHDALVVQSLMAPGEGDVERADQLARELLEVTDLPPESYTMMASLRSAMLEGLPSRESHWLTAELAWRGFGLTDRSDRSTEAQALDSAFGSLLSYVAGTSGIDKALASADSVAAAMPDQTLAAVLNANKYRLAVDEYPDQALSYARALSESRGPVYSWRIPNGIAVDVRNRGLDYDLALDLSGWALDLAAARDDSQTVLSSLGWAHHLKGDNETARKELESSLTLLRDAPSLDDSVVRRLLDVYEEESQYDRAIGLLASGIARSVEPNDEARERLAELLSKAGRGSEDVSDVVAAHRYDGVKEAPPFAVVSGSGEAVDLPSLSGKIVLLNFWSYGCLPCRDELPHLSELASTFADRPVSVIAALQGKRTIKIDTLVAESNAEDVLYIDESGDASDAFNVVGVPTTVIIDDAGRLMFRHVGFSEGLEDEFAAEIEKLLAWRTPA